MSHEPLEMDRISPESPETPESGRHLKVPDEDEVRTSSVPEKTPGTAAAERAMTTDTDSTDPGTKPKQQRRRVPRTAEWNEKIRQGNLRDWGKKRAEREEEQLNLADLAARVVAVREILGSVQDENIELRAENLRLKAELEAVKNGKRSA